jgi:hypothetical protein
MDSLPIVQALRLPRGTVQTVVPTLIHQEKVYAYEMAVALATRWRLHLDVRQFPLDAPTLVGTYGELVAYITSFTSLAREPMGTALSLGRYLGLQSSIVFFPELLTRYRLLKLGIGKDADDFTSFQVEYDRVSAAYHSLGFPLEPFQEVPLLHTEFGAFMLGAQAAEQLAEIAHVGEQLFFEAKIFSLASFKQISLL